jgi:TonB-linked SusC/RagA family outer membrane protein
MMNSQQYAAAKTAAWLAAGRDTSFTNLWPDPLEQYGIQNGVSTDWQKLILRTGRQARHQLGINTISGNTRLSLTGSYFDQAGITLGQGYQMYSGTASLDHTTGPLHVGLTVTGTRSHADVGMGDGLWGQSLAMSPLGLAYDTLGLLKWKPTADPLLVNPLIEIPGYIRQLDRNRLFGSFFAEFQITKELSWRTNFGPDISNNSDGRFRGALTIDRNGTSPDAYFERQQNFAYTFDNLLRFSRQFGTMHRVEATALYSVQRTKYTMNHAEASNLPYDQQLWYNLGTGQVIGPVSSDYRETALAGYMGRLNYALADKYLLTVTGRYDGSSLLAPGHKWSFFPSVGLGWQVGDEPFFRRSPLGRAFSSLKLRGSWGVSGNSSLAPYQTEGSLAYTRYAFGAAAAFGYQPNGIPNPDLKWEKTASTNVGVDFGVFANRITGSLEVYRENTYDLMMYRQLPPTSGFTQTLANIGKTANQGWEFNLSTVNIPGRAGSLRWTTDISLTHNKNWIVSLYGKNLDDVGNRWFIGQPINVGGAVAPPAGSGATVATTSNGDPLRNVFYDYKMIGIWQLADSALAASYGQRPGDIRVLDINGDGRITAADRFIQGTTYPKLLGSFYNRVSLGHFDASVLLTFRLGYTIYDAFGVGNSVLAGRYNNIVVDYWTPQNCPLNDPRSLTAACNTNPRPNGSREDPQYSTTRGYVSAGHARIRNITVGYTFPAGVARYFRMSSLRVYMQALDPFLFSNYHGYDPEAGTANAPPSYRTVVFGTTVGF